ncbi:pre-RNA processing PIH1/Nop17-domain-containing protein, partial [Endogone sp. FLAS-F59071]
MVLDYKPQETGFGWLCKVMSKKTSTALLDVEHGSLVSANPFLLSELVKEDAASGPTPPFPDDEALVEHFSQELSKNPAALERLAAHLSQPVEDTSTYAIEVEPQPGFVCRTVMTAKTERYVEGTRVYINVCYAAEIPEPPTVPEQEIQKALNADPGATYQVPMSLGKPRTEVDRAEKTILIFDACINTNPYIRAEGDLDYRLYIFELAMELVNEKEGVSLSREFTMPNIKSKGAIPKRIVRVPRPPLISNITSASKTASSKVQPVDSGRRRAVDMAGSTVKAKTGDVIVTAITPMAKGQQATPRHEIGGPENGKLSISIHIPELPSTSVATVDIEPRRLIFDSPGKYFLDVTLPVEIDVVGGLHRARFWKKKRVLVVDMAVVKNDGVGMRGGLRGSVRICKSPIDSIGPIFESHRLQL